MEKDLIFKILDETLSKILLAKESGKETKEINILIQGNELKGFDGLKAGDIVTEWAKQNEDKINYYALYCPTLNKNSPFYNNAVAVFNSIGDKPNSIVILKCLDWTQERTREQFLALVKDRVINTETDKKKLENILFIVATDNDSSRMGYESLDEKTKNLFKVIKL